MGWQGRLHAHLHWRLIGFEYDDTEGQVQAAGKTTPLSPHPIHQPFNWLKQAYKRDRLGVVGVGSATVAAALWVLPFDCASAQQVVVSGAEGCHWWGNWFRIESALDGNLYAEAIPAGILGIVAIVALLYRAGAPRGRR